MPINLTPITRETSREPLASSPNWELVAPIVEQVTAAQIALYDRTQATMPWIGYLAADADSREILGSCSFVGMPADGAVEIAYFTFPHAERRGIAKAMARELIEMARIAGSISTVFAHTLPEENPSTRILKGLGFEQTGAGRCRSKRSRIAVPRGCGSVARNQTRTVISVRVYVPLLDFNPEGKWPEFTCVLLDSILSF